MKQFFIVSMEDPWECQGAFDASGKFLDLWSCNDGSWRSEYFGFLSRLGVEEIEPTASELAKAEKKMRIEMKKYC
jgi:hypothetical protein